MISIIVPDDLVPMNVENERLNKVNLMTNMTVKEVKAMAAKKAGIDAHNERNAKLHEEAVAKKQARIDAHKARNAKSHEDAVAKKQARIDAHNERNAKAKEDAKTRKAVKIAEKAPAVTM